jgi:hypothetical protein
MTTAKRSPVVLRLLCHSLLTAATLCVTQASAQDAFTPLFNGRDLTGWVLVNTPPETWSISDSMLVCSGRPIGEIRTERMYQNFILEVEWRHMLPGGNAGIFVWADDITARGVPFHRSIEVQVLDHAYGQSRGHTTHGDIFPIHGATMTPMNGRGGSRAFPTEERSKPSPEWNHYRIECRDGSISLAVNGKVVTRGSDASPRKGYICIESEGGVVHYRNLRIQELPETPVTPAQTAIANRGFRSLYNGLNLDGWTASDTSAERWKSNDWKLSYDGTASGLENSLLRSGQPITNRGFIVDILPKQGCTAAAIAGCPVPPELLVPDKWVRLEATVQDGRITLMADGKPTGQPKAVTADAVFSLQVSGPAEFANLYVREL